MSEERKYKIHEVQPAAYVLEHPATGKVYVGSTNKPGLRISRHKTLLKGGRHDNPRLQEAYNASPELISKVYPTEDREAAFAKEQKLLNEALAKSSCFNIGTDVRAANKGRVTSPEARAKQSAAKKGRTRDPALVEKTATALRGAPKSEDHRRKLSDAKKGKPQPESVQAQLRARNAARAKPVSIEGVVYDGIRVAARELSMSRDTVKYRVKSDQAQWADWRETT